MAAELSRPGVEVIQKFRKSSPTIVTPTLVPVVVGVCKQTVSVVERTPAGAAALNQKSLVVLPASLLAAAAVGVVPVYTGLDGLNLVLSINGGVDVTITIAGTSVTPASIAAQFADKLLAAGVVNATAKVYGTTQFRFVTYGRTEFESIEVRTGTHATVLSTFGWVIGHIRTGSSLYTQSDMSIPLADFPDPHSNLTELSIEPATVRTFLSLGAGVNLKELSRTEAFLRRGGNDIAASLRGTVTASTGGLYGGGGTLAGTTLTLAIDGGSPFSIVMGTGGSAPVSEKDLRGRINAAAGYPLVALDTQFLFTSPTTGPTSSILVSGTSAALLGLSTTIVNGTKGITCPTEGTGTITTLLKVANENFSAAGTAASCTSASIVSGITYPGDLTGLTLILSVNGAPPQTWVIPSLANQAAFLAALGAFFVGVTATVNGSSKLVLTSTDTGTDSGIKVIGGTACNVLSLVPSVLGRWDLGTAGVYPDLTTLNSKKLNVSAPNGTAEITFTGLTNVDVPAAVATFLNAQTAFSTIAAASIESGALRIRAHSGGAEGSVPVSLSILPASSADAAPYLGLGRYDSATYYRFEGGAEPPLPGDDVYVDGVLLGRVLKVAPNAATDTLKLDKRMAVSAVFGSKYWINARSLTANVAARPDPELIVDGLGVPSFKQDLLRDTSGAPLVGSANVYLSYRAIRRDVSPLAKLPGLLTVSSTTDLESIMEVTADNPLGLGIYLALLNAPGATVSGIGVDAVSADSPYGTVEAFTRAAEFLEAYEVYAIAPMTHDETVGQVFSAHVSAMSAPASKGERIVVFNHAQPTKRLDKLVASGTNGNSAGSAGLQFDTGVSSLTGLTQNAGVNPVGTIPVESGLFLDIASDAKRYSIASINGAVVTIRTAFTAGQNDDSFYATTDLNDSPLATTLISEPFAVRVRGASLTRVDGTPDKLGMAETYQALAMSIANRRFINMVLDRTVVSIGGLDQTIEGFYACAARVGMIGGQPPQQSFTTFPMVGLKSVSGTNKYFSEKQLRIIAAGGNDILIHETDGAPVTSRHALTTDMSSIETRTDSINRVVDFSAKFIRKSVRSFIGRFNITQGFIDTLSNVFQGLIGFLVETGVLIGGSLNKIEQDKDEPDVVLADCTIDPPVPCNFLRITLVI